MMDETKQPHTNDNSPPKYSLPNSAPGQNNDLATPKSRRIQPKIAFLNYVAALLLICWLGYQFLNLINHTISKNHFTFLSDRIQIMDLPSHYVPYIGKDQPLRRLVIIGDVHGMKQPLVNLLEEIKYNGNHDHLVLAGDLISKGPDSSGVVDMAMDLGATCIRGNHEDAVLLAWKEMKTHGFSSEESEDERDLVDDENGSRNHDHHTHRSYHSSKRDRALVRALGKRRLQWLNECPVILRVGHLGVMGRVLVVHAGLEPGVALEKQDPDLVMNMRSFKHGAPCKARGKAWTKAWNKFQRGLKKSNRQTVFYGHDSRRGLSIKRYSIGLDTGCVKGKKLTAAIIGGDNSMNPYEIFSVSCSDDTI